MSKFENHRLFLLMFASLSGLTLISSGAQARDLSSYARGMSFGLEYIDTMGWLMRMLEFQPTIHS